MKLSLRLKLPLIAVFLISSIPSVHALSMTVINERSDNVRYAEFIGDHHENILFGPTVKPREEKNVAIYELKQLMNKKGYVGIITDFAILSCGTLDFNEKNDIVIKVYDKIGTETGCYVKYY